MEKKEIRGETDHCRDRLMKYCRGQGLDLGCGHTRIKPEAIAIDLHNPQADMLADARVLDMYPDGMFDYVYSSHLLEEIENTEATLREWLRILKNNGYVVLYQADKDLYYPLGHHLCNRLHKHHFSWEELWAVFQKIGGTKLIHYARYSQDPYKEWSFELIVQKTDGATEENIMINGGISILVPTLNRPNHIARFATSIYKTSKFPDKVEILFGVHEDDTVTIGKIDELREMLHTDIRCEFINRCEDKKPHLPFFWNQLYPRARYNIVGFFGDDVEFKTPGWDEEVFKEFEKDKLILVACNDVHIQRGSKATLFFTHKLFHDKVGYYMNERFRRWCMDAFWHEVFKAAGKLHYREDLVTEHFSPDIFHDRTDKVYTDMDEFKNPDKNLWNTEETQKEITRCVEILKNENNKLRPVGN